MQLSHKDDLYGKDIELKNAIIENWKLKHQIATKSASSSSIYSYIIIHNKGVMDQ